MVLQFRCAAASHVGLVRSGNEDSGFAGPYLLLVADGVGGAAAGEVASATCTYVGGALSMVARDADPVSVLAEAVARSAEQLRVGVAEDAARTGMASTFVAVATDGRRFGLAHVGDSRAYWWRDGRLQPLTTDHTLVRSWVEEGVLTEAEARRSPHRNVVLRSVGADGPAEPDLLRLDLRPGDRLLLCSDGLTDFVADAEVGRLLAVADRDDAVQHLVDAALAAGGRDNVTCVVADVVDADPVDSVGRMVGAVADPWLVVDPACVRAS